MVKELSMIFDPTNQSIPPPHVFCMTAVESVAALSLQLQHENWSRGRLGGESGEVRLCVFPPRTAVRCSVSMATWLTQSPHDGAGLLQRRAVCLIVNVWWFCKRENRKQRGRWKDAV